MFSEFAPRVHFAHLRSVQREPDGSFHEADHLEGDGDLIGLVALLMSEERRRGEEIPMRPDHGALIGGDDPRRSNPGYSYVGRLKGLAELRGAMRTCGSARAGSAKGGANSVAASSAPTSRHSAGAGLAAWHSCAAKCSASSRRRNRAPQTPSTSRTIHSPSCEGPTSSRRLAPEF
jgi:hypothetical protein